MKKPSNKCAECKKGHATYFKELCYKCYSNLFTELDSDKKEVTRRTEINSDDL